MRLTQGRSDGADQAGGGQELGHGLAELGILSRADELLGPSRGGASTVRGSRPGHGPGFGHDRLDHGGSRRANRGFCIKRATCALWFYEEARPTLPRESDQ